MPLNIPGDAGRDKIIDPRSLAASGADGARRDVECRHGNVVDAAPEPKQFFPIHGAGHNDTYFIGGDPYWEAWGAFLGGLPAAAGSTQ